VLTKAGDLSKEKNTYRVSGKKKRGARTINRVGASGGSDSIWVGGVVWDKEITGKRVEKTKRDMRESRGHSGCPFEIWEGREGGEKWGI